MEIPTGPCIPQAERTISKSLACTAPTTESSGTGHSKSVWRNVLGWVISAASAGSEGGRWNK